jgi:DNA adenine methylase
MQYLGGKAKIAKQIATFLESVRKPGQLYVEPFLGGCNVLPLMSGDRIGSDINADIMKFYQELRGGWVPPTHVTEEEYQTLKNSTEVSALRGFVGIACSYSGKWFGGYARDGKGRNYALNGHNTAMKLVPKLQEVVLLTDSYQAIEFYLDWCAGIGNMMIYCDPPYRGTTGYSYKFNHDEFWDWVRRNSECNDIYVSEYSAPDDFEVVWSLERNLEMKSSNKSGNTKRVEKIFKYTGGFR